MKKRIVPLTILLLLVAVYFSISIISNIVRINEKEKQLEADLKALEAQEEKVREQEDLLESEVDEEYIKKIAKDVLGLVERMKKSTSSTDLLKDVFQSPSQGYIG